MQSEPPAKRFRLVSNILELKLKEKALQRSRIAPEQELYHYWAANYSLSEEVDPVIFWAEQERAYPLLSLFVIPASSTPVEHVFSTAGVLWWKAKPFVRLQP